MAKNLKINVKNAQLAQALKLGQLKKPAVKKKKESSAEASADETAHLPHEAAAETTPPPASPEKKKVKKATTGDMAETASPSIEKPNHAPEKVVPTQESASPKLSAKEESSPAAESIPRKETSSTERAPYAQPQSPSLSSPPRRDSYPSQQREGGYPPRRDAYPSQQREGGGYAPRRDSYPSQPREGGYPPRRDSYPPQQREGGGGYPPRREGYAPQQRDNGGGYPPRREGYAPQQREGGGYPPRREGYAPQQRDNGGSYPPRREGFAPQQREGGGYPPRREGYAPRPPGQGPRPGGYAPRPGGYPPRPGGFAPRPGGYPPRTGGGFTPRPFGPSPSGGEQPPRSEKGGKTPQRIDETRKAMPQKEMREHKPQKKQSDSGFDSRDRLGLRDRGEDQGWRKRRPAQKMRSIQQDEIIRPKSLKVRLPITLKDLAYEMKLKASQLISKLFMKGVVITLNDYLDDETTVQLLGQDFDCEIAIDTTEEDRLRITDKTIKQEISESDPEALVYRPPVVAFMGHVDHGKTSLIDAIRKTNVAQGEAGAITQHIGAFKCHTDTGDITILDTPGHEAFSAMRARGADVTDIVVLVVAGDEGIRPQTVEALEQAQAANVPIVVAISKSDKPNFNAETVYRQLADKNLLPEVWGGQTITVNCSAVSGAGIKELLEMLALQAEVLELKANQHSRARGTVIESEMHKGMGSVATMLVQNGTLRIGDAIVFAQHFARVKTMQDEFGKELTEAGPSTPVKITGLSGMPEAGSEFIVVKNEKEAMLIAEKRSEGKQHILHQAKRAGVESLLSEKANGIQKKYLNLILRADVQGSLEALKTSLLKIVSQKVELNIISSAVGEISESDVQLAQTSKAIIIGFHTQVESHAESLIKQLKVTIKLHDIIYHAVDDVRELMTKILDKIPQENNLGSAEVRMTFKASQVGVIAGCMVTDGIIKRGCQVRQIRDKQVIWKGTIGSLKRIKEDIRETSKGHECGILLHNNNDVKAGDILEAFEITYIEQEL